MDLDNNAIVNIKDADYRSIISGDKQEAPNFMNNFLLGDVRSL